MLNYSAEVDPETMAKEEGVPGAGDVQSAQALIEIQRLEEVERALDALGQFERDIVEEGGAPGSTCYALKIVSGLPPYASPFRL